MSNLLPVHTAWFAAYHRITSYNVCYTKLLRKTTLFRTITGDITTNNGATILGNQNLTTLKPRQRAQRLAIVCQETEQQPIRVSDYVAMGRYAYYRPFQINGSKSDQRIIDRS